MRHVCRGYSHAARYRDIRHGTSRAALSLRQRHTYVTGPVEQRYHCNELSINQHCFVCAQIANSESQLRRSSDFSLHIAAAHQLGRMSLVRRSVGERVEAAPTARQIADEGQEVGMEEEEEEYIQNRTRAGRDLKH